MTRSTKRKHPTEASDVSTLPFSAKYLAQTDHFLDNIDEKPVWEGFCEVESEPVSCNDDWPCSSI